MQEIAENSAVDMNKAYCISYMICKKYEIVYADSPWQYKVYSDKVKGRSAESHYPTMKIEDICNLPVKNITAKNCVLFMWVTFSTLLDGLKVIEKWGFKYKTIAFVWIKQNKKSSIKTIDKKLLNKQKIKKI